MTHPTFFVFYFVISIFRYNVITKCRNNDITKYRN